MRAPTVAAIAGAVAAAAIVLAVFYYYTYPAAQQVTSGGSNNSNSSGIEPAVMKGGLKGYNQTVVTIGGVQLVADIADTPEKQTLGLDVRESMDESQAMLFPFKNPSILPFWMNGMKFPLDIIWIGEDMRVVHVEHGLKPCPNSFDCPSYQPSENAKYVLETVAGFAKKHGVDKGTPVEFELP